MAKRGSTKAKKLANTRSESPVEAVSEDYVSGGDDEDAQSIHSDALDEKESDDAGAQKKRRRVASSSKCAQNSKKHETDSKSKRRGVPEKSPAKKKRKVVEDTAEDEHDSDVELKDGQEVVGKVVEAPTTGWGTSSHRDLQVYSSHVTQQRLKVRYLSTRWIS